ncbi:hypothetical protein GOP47_0006590 [Adiantum capillus-veneris]|uniref:Transcription elongation factor spt6 n=1 Tax=Adiantum capillus-veneris TaxID=13818 RepID=A0A9D4V3K2_ADICA|nr:hypothetical protein GOP47_0006590 [Adiantum capillus-veneris]
MGARTVSSDEEDIEEREDDMEDNEAAADNADNDEEDEEEDEGQDEYEKDDFIVDDVEEEEEEQEQVSSGEEEAKLKKKKRKKRDAEENYELDEEDYELLQENVHGFHRPKSSSKTKFKRLKKAGRVANDGEREGQAGLSDDEELEEGNRHGRTAEEELKRTLFGDDEGVPPEDLGEEEVEEEEEDIGEEDDMADFIVDEEMVDENGQPVRRGKTRKKGPRQAAGISSSALQEAQEIFGDVTELLDRRKYGLTGERGDEENEDEGREGYHMGRSSKKKLEEEFEPSILEERYMTERDNRIRETDVPERLQLLDELIGIIPPKQPKFEEAEWIYDQGFGYPLKILPREYEYLLPSEKDKDKQKRVVIEKAEVVKQIEFVLTQLHDSKSEIPFIGMYRREGCPNLVGAPVSMKESKKKEEAPNLRDFKLLWQIFSMDKKWRWLQRRKAALAEAYEKRARLEEQKNSENLDMLKKLLAALQEARSQVAVDDVDAKYTLHFPPDEVDFDQSQFKRPKRKSAYSTYRKNGLGVVAGQFGLTPEQFGENLQAMYKRHEVEDSSSTPEDLAAKEQDIGDSQSVLRGARYMAAIEISTEPAVRDYVRNVYSERAVLSTKPTKDGNTVIDANHDYAVVKWLSNKPLGAFKDGQWLMIQKAEEEKLIEVSLGLPKDASNTLMQEFEVMYLSDGVSRTAQLWNEQRRQIIKDALNSILLPFLEKETRMVLTMRAKQWVTQECGLTLWKKAAMAPWKDVSEDGIEDDELPRVLACCYGDTMNISTTFVMLDSSGEIINTLHTAHLFSAEKDPRKQNDMERLEKFMLEYQPQIAVVGAGGGPKSIQARKTILQAVHKLIEMYPKEVKEKLEHMNTNIVDESLARIYEASSISKEQLPGQPGIVRRAVYLGRYLQSPLASIASLCGPNREILSFSLHELQNFLTNDEKYAVIEQMLVTITNQVGIDINMAAVHDWLFAPLQFICGLGARKASVIQRSIQGAGRISTRKEMLTPLRLMKKNVFINACGSLRICSSGQAASGNQVMDPLDDTRIHPESYDLARNMAELVYDEAQKQEDDEVEEDIIDVAFEYVKSHPHIIQSLDIEEYIKMVEEKYSIIKPETLRDIQKELLHGFKEWRYAYSPPSDDEIFTLLTGETEQTLGAGRVVTVKVVGVLERGIRCELGNGLTGFIQKDDFSDDATADHQQAPLGMMITCRVKNINKSIIDDSPRIRYYSVDLTFRNSAMRGDDWEKVWSKETFFAKDALLKSNEQEKATKAKDDEKRKSFKPRMIVHPQFQNISMSDAIESLAEKDVGEIIIRPSSKGPTHLSITLKFYDGVYTHIDVLEGGKDSKDFTSFLSLGKSLKIGEDVFEDLDEVIARYVDPLVGNLKEMLRYRKFRRGRKEEVDAHLKQEKLVNPSRIVYAFSVSHEHPGAFLLSYLRSANVHHEYISLYPKGSLAAMVPMKGPAPAAAAGGTWGSAERRSPTTWDNGGWNASKGPAQANWERLSVANAMAVPAASNWGGRGVSGLSEGWGRGGGPSGDEGWEKGSRAEYQGGRGRADHQMVSGERYGGGFRGGGRFGRGDSFRGGFGGRSGRGPGGRGGRWEREGQNNRGPWGQGQGRGGWAQAQSTSHGRVSVGAAEDDGWGGDTPARAKDAGGWGQPAQTEDVKDGWSNDGGGGEPAASKGGWGEQKDGETKKQQGWRDEDGGWGQNPASSSGGGGGGWEQTPRDATRGQQADDGW